MNEVLVKIHAEKRLKTGTGNSREFRSNKLIPGIIYGEKKEPIPISLNEKELKLQLNDTGFFSKQCEITLDNENFKVLPKDVQLHPVKENILAHRFSESRRKHNCDAICSSKIHK